MSNSTDYFECPKCGGQATRDQDNTTCEIIHSCSNCDWRGEDVEKKISGLKFICPKCNHNELEIIEANAIVSSNIININEEGDFDYINLSVDDSVVDRFQCVNCGYVLEDENEERITDNLDVVEWIKKNCPQK